MRIKPRAIATVLCMIFFVGFAVCGVVRSTDKETLEIKQSYPALAEAEPMIMADLLMESPNLTPEVEKEPDYANLNNTASNSNSNNGAALSYP